MFTKLALLWLIIRIFRPHRRTTIVAFAVVTLLTGYTVPIVSIKALICRPVAGFWDPAIKATCYNQRAIYVADTAVSTISDMAVLFLPVPVVMTLQMSWYKRLQVIAMLSSGGLAVVASLVRTILVIKLQTSQDETLDLVRFNLLGTAEVGIGLICACLPATHILISRSLGCSSPTIQHRIPSSRAIAMGFLRGRRHRSQRMIATEVAPEVVFRGFITPVLAEQGRNGCIFPFERVSRPSPTSQKDACREARQNERDEWYSQVIASPFSGPRALDWIEEAVDS
ncbi:Satratoxin biosynthesis SC1 cluster protein 4 [Colletotrichum sidae]|uniref:Satratoxin biosynthesis SC1 cluster protein 4 n=1 Tax=Colletotrichum sidae TaxID=1347389 RepID=A0A4R8TQP4_9PEZI|nr:Satratoxin biosynthesis SC1 cluster protein 4 [Colletotrichum sidae]